MLVGKESGVRMKSASSSSRRLNADYWVGLCCEYEIARENGKKEPQQS